MSNTGAINIVPYSVPVGLPGGEQVVTLFVADLFVPLAIQRQKGKVHREDTFRATISEMDGYLRDVLIDTYRCLVDGNFVYFDGRGGHVRAAAAASNGYPDRKTLPGFQNKTDGFNGAGDLIWNLLVHPETSQPGYRVMGAILVALLEQGVFDPPTMDALPRGVQPGPPQGPRAPIGTISLPAAPPLVKTQMTPKTDALDSPPKQLQSSYLQSGDAGAEGGYEPTFADQRQLAMRQIKERRGQQAFRSALLIRYTNTCSVSGCCTVHVLEAAHIVPHLGADDNHPENGLLLRADLHTLFDLDLMGIEPGTYTIHFHPKVKDEPTYRALAGKRLTNLYRTPSPEALAYRWRLFQSRLSQDL